MHYYCDTRRHLVCRPYTVPNLHQMAAELGIAKAWFHRGDKPHYDIPQRRQAEIQAKCHLVSPRRILELIQTPMHILVISLDGRTKADLLTALREALRQAEADQLNAKHAEPALSYSLHYYQTVNPPTEPDPITPIP